MNLKKIAKTNKGIIYFVETKHYNFFVLNKHIKLIKRAKETELLYFLVENNIKQIKEYYIPIDNKVRYNMFGYK